MKKEIYKNVPREFHDRFMDTIEQIAAEERTARSIISWKKAAVLIAALVAALSTLTVGAAYLYKWHQTAKRSFGVSDELADKLVMEGAAKEEMAVIHASDVTIRAIQSVAAENYYYVLLTVDTPQGVIIDEDTVFDRVEVISDNKTASAVINYVSGSFEDHESLWEIKVLHTGEAEYAGKQVTVKIADLVRTTKTKIVDTLVEGEWILPVTLPLQPQEAVLCQAHVLMIENHEVNIDRIEAGPFQIRLYGEEEELLHALQYHTFMVSGVAYMDGSFTEQNVELRGTAAIEKDCESGEIYINIPLKNAVDVSKVAVVCLTEMEDEVSQGLLWDNSPKTQEPEVLYERNGHAIVYDEQSVYLWDRECDVIWKIADLTAIDFSVEQGGSIVVGPGGKTITILPNATSDKIYVADVEYGLNAEQNLHEMAKAGNWAD